MNARERHCDSNKTSVLIVDDHFVVRNGLIAVLEIEQDLLVVATAESAAAGLDMYRKKKPDVVMLDLYLPDMSGSEVVHEFLKIDPLAKILIYSAYARDEGLKSVIDAGAMGYVQKSSDRDELIHALRMIAGGGRHISASLQQRIRRLRCAPNITPREREILALIVRGKSNKEIASILDISVDTVKQHISTSLKKLEVHDRAEAAVEAIRRGLIVISE